LYTIKNIPSLKVLDHQRITKTERDRAERLASSSAGAALESDVQSEGRQSKTKTFTPGEGSTAEESFVVSFTPEEKEQIRLMVANAKSPQEIEEIERSVKRGVLPRLVAEDSQIQQDSADSDGSRKRAAESDNGGGDGSGTEQNTKRPKR
jgi:hypothetical protein